MFNLRNFFKCTAGLRTMFSHYRQHYPSLSTIQIIPTISFSLSLIWATTSGFPNIIINDSIFWYLFLILFFQSLFTYFGQNNLMSTIHFQIPLFFYFLIFFLIFTIERRCFVGNYFILAEQKFLICKTFWTANKQLFLALISAII